MSSPAPAPQLPEHLLFQMSRDIASLMERTNDLPGLTKSVARLETKMTALVGNGQPGRLDRLEAKIDERVRRTDEDISRLARGHRELKSHFEAQRWFQQGRWKTLALLGASLASTLTIALEVYRTLHPHGH